MRVVFLTHNYPRHVGDVSGSFLHLLAVALQRAGVEVRVVAPSDAGRGGRSELEGIPVRRVRYGSAAQEVLAYRGTMANATRSAEGLRSLARLIRALRAGAAEELAGETRAVVHAHWWFPSGVATPQGAALVQTCHGTDVRLMQGNAFIRWLGRRTCRRSAVLTTVSRSLAEALTRVTRIPVGADRIQPMPVRVAERAPSRGGGGAVVLGRLSVQKRVHLAIDAAKVMHDRGTPLRLTIVGDGDTRASLEQQVSRLGLREQVRFLGSIEPERVPEVFAEADLCVMPAIGEGFGLVAAEAMMQGVPVVACNDGGGVLDVVPGNGAGRVTDATAEAIAVGMLSVLGDPFARAQARSAGNMWRERLAPEVVAQRCLSWYAEALGE